MTAFIVLVLVNVLDGYLTYRLISGGGKELNPIMACVMEILGVAEALICIKLAMLGLVYALDLGDWVWLLVVIFSAACIWNLKETKWNPLK